MGKKEWFFIFLPTSSSEWNSTIYDQQWEYASHFLIDWVLIVFYTYVILNIYPKMLGSLSYIIEIIFIILFT